MRQVTPWLYAIARHKLIDAYRRRGRRIDVEIDEIADTFAAAPEPDRLSEREIGKALVCWRPASARSFRRFRSKAARSARLPRASA